MDNEKTTPLENIKNAFDVVIKTYQNIEKLLSEMDAVGNKEGFLSLSPRFLRYKSENDTLAWLVSFFIKVYQHSSDPVHDQKNDVRNGPFYIVDVEFGDLTKNAAKYPDIVIAETG